MSIASKVCKAASLMCAAVLAGALMVGLTACSANDEKAIKDGINTELGAFKNPTKESLETYVNQVSSADFKQIEAYGIDIYEFLGHCFSKFDYSIGKVSVNGNTATAEISLTNVDVQTAMKDTMTEFEALGQEELARIYTEGGEKALMAKYFEAFYSKLDATSETVSSDLTIKLTKTDNVWNIDNDSLNALVSAAYGGANFSNLM